MEYNKFKLFFLLGDFQTLRLCGYKKQARTRKPWLVLVSAITAIGYYRLSIGYLSVLSVDFCPFRLWSMLFKWPIEFSKYF